MVCSENRQSGTKQPRTSRPKMLACGGLSDRRVVVRKDSEGHLSLGSGSIAVPREVEERLHGPARGQEPTHAELLGSGGRPSSPTAGATCCSTLCWRDRACDRGGLRSAGQGRVGSVVRVRHSLWWGQLYSPKTEAGKREVDLNSSIAERLQEHVGKRTPAFVFQTRRARRDPEDDGQTKLWLPRVPPLSHHASSQAASAGRPHPALGRARSQDHHR
jgi:hypothetical protein